MKLRDFELEDIEIIVGEQVYDLHNNYKFQGFTFDVNSRELTLNWVCGIGEWIPKGSPSKITISASEVSFLSVSPRKQDAPYSEDDCLNCVMVVEHNQNTEDCYSISNPVAEELHYVFEFMSGFSIRVQANEAFCRIG
jgi:hypothetical protein